MYVKFEHLHIKFMGIANHLNRVKMRLSILVVIIILFKDSSTIKEFDLINID